MKKLIAYLTILLFLPGVIGTGAEEKTGSKTGEPDPQYAQLVKADLVKEIQQRWEFMSLGSDTYQYELAQLAQQAKSNTASKKSKEKLALEQKIASLSTLLNEIQREVEDSLNNLTLNQALLLYGKTSAVLKGVDEVRYSVMMAELFGGTP